MNKGQYLIADYTRLMANGKPSLILVYDDEIWKFIDKAKDTGDKIAVFEVSDCVLDWS